MSLRVRLPFPAGTEVEVSTGHRSRRCARKARWSTCSADAFVHMGVRLDAPMP